MLTCSKNKFHTMRIVLSQKKITPAHAMHRNILLGKKGIIAATQGVKNINN